VVNINQPAKANWLITPPEGSPFPTHFHITKNFYKRQVDLAGISDGKLRTIPGTIIGSV
jgi:hypothetical protein